MQQFFLNLYERASLSLGIAGLNGSDWNLFMFFHLVLFTEQICHAAVKAEDTLVYRSSLAASCCLGAEREAPMPAGLLGLLLFRTFCAVNTKASDAVEPNDLLEALHPLQQEQRYVQRGQRQHHPQISAGQATGEMNI